MITKDVSVLLNRVPLCITFFLPTNENKYLSDVQRSGCVKYWGEGVKGAEVWRGGGVEVWRCGGEHRQSHIAGFPLAVAA